MSMGIIGYHNEDGDFIEDEVVTKRYNAEKESTMDNIELRLLAHQVTSEQITFVNVVYCDDSKKTQYTYKVDQYFYLKPDDIVLVPRGPNNILVSAKVVKCDTTVSLDTDIRYKWVVAKINEHVESARLFHERDERLREQFRQEEFRKTLADIHNSKK